MTKGEKQLLLKDLSARLPYGVICQLSSGDTSITEKLGIGGLSDFMNGSMKIKPYLRPMSSMTAKEIEEAIDIKRTVLIQNVGEWYKYEIPNSAFIDWLNAHHFDYRGLIEKGLALEAPEGMYKIE